MRWSSPLARTVGVLVLTAAAAATMPAAPDPEPTPRTGWVTDGWLASGIHAGNALYVGGSFSRIAPAANVVGSLYALAPDTGALAGATPFVDGTVRAIEPDAGGGAYIGGSFTSIGGQPRPYLAHLLADGSLDPAFAPQIDREVSDLALGAGGLFVSGFFVTVAGQNRAGLAALDPFTGALLPWTQSGSGGGALLAADGDVLLTARFASISALSQTTGAALWSTTINGVFFGLSDIVVAGSRVIVGGDFTRIGTPPIRNLMSLDLVTGAVDTSWSPFGSDPGSVRALAVSGSTLYVGGFFSSFGSQPRQFAAAVDVPAGLVTGWNPQLDGTVFDLAAASGGEVYLAGQFVHVGGTRRAKLAKVDASGQLLPWVAGASSYLNLTLALSQSGTVLAGGDRGLAGGLPRTNVAAFDVNTGEPLAWAPNVDGVSYATSVTSLAALGGSIFLSGQFTEVNGAPRGGMAAVSQSGQVLPWNPSPDGGATLYAAGAHVYVAGFFNSIGGLPPGVSPRYLAKLDPVTGAADPAWRPNPDYPPRAMIARGGLLYLGGVFAVVQGQFRSRLAAVDLETGTVAPWNPGVATGLPIVSSLALDGQTMYVGGTFDTVGGQPRRNFAAVDAVSGVTTAWNTGATPPPGISGESLAVADGQVVVTGFQGAQSRFLAQAIDATGSLTAWRPMLGESVDTSSTMPAIIVTPLDLVLTGRFRAMAPVPVQGLAAFPRTGSVTPTGLNAALDAGVVRVRWSAPTAINATGYVLEAGSVPGGTDLLVSPPMPSTGMDAIRPPDGTYFVRVRAQLASGGTSGPSNEIALRFGCTAPPSPPSRPVVELAGNRVTLEWTPSHFDEETGVRIEAGSAPGLADIATLTRFAPPPLVADVPPGTYFVRLRSINACGVSDASSEITFTAGSASAIPPPPQAPGVAVSGASVTVTWPAVTGATSYVVEAGSGHGLANLARLTVNEPVLLAPAVPRGVYYLRVRAVSAAGTGSPSPEAVAVVF